MLWASQPLGRLGWWLAQFFFIACFILFATGVTIIAPLIAIRAGGGHQDKAWAEQLVNNQTPLVALGIAVTLGCIWSLWSLIVADVRRWHDLGMSGFWVLLRGFPVLVHQIAHYLPSPAWQGILILGVALIQLACLGFVPSVPAYSLHLQRTPGRFDRRPLSNPQPPPKSGFIGWFILGLLFFLTTGVVAVFGLKILSVKDVEAGRIPINIFTNTFFHVTEPPPPASSGKPAMLGTSVTNFGKDWVMINDDRLSGISSVQPTAYNQVSLIYLGGGKTVSASTLPNGFFTLWNITQARLDGVNTPTPSTP